MNTRTVLVSNLASSVTEKQLSDFFSFCGKIVSLTFRSKGFDVEAILEFERESSTNTALLLNNAIIDGKSIKVQLYTEEQLEVHKEEDQQTKIILEKQDLNDPQPEDFPEDAVKVTEVPQENITKRPGERSATAAIASLIANGYVLASNALNSAKQLDEEKGISQSFQEGADTIRNKAKDLDTEYKISESASNASRSISEGWQNLDQQYKISESTSVATNFVSEKWNALSTTVAGSVSEALQKPSVQDTLFSFNNWSNNVSKSIGEFFRPVGDTITQEYTQIKEESSRIIAEKQAEQSKNQSPIPEMEELSDMNDIEIEPLKPVNDNDPATSTADFPPPSSSSEC